MKICSKCHETKTDSHYKRRFYKKTNKSYTSKICTACVYAKSAEWHAKNKNLSEYKENAKENVRKWRDTHRDKYLEYCKKYNATNKSKRVIYSLNYYNKNIEMLRPYRLTIAKKNREKLSKSYLRVKIKKSTGIPLADIPTELIELKGKQIQIWRLQKQLSNSSQTR